MRAGAQRLLGAVAVLLCAGIGCGGVAVAAAPVAVPQSVSAEGAGTQATLRWSEPAGGGPASAMELAIHQDAWSPGTLLVASLQPADCSPCGVETPPGGSPLTVADLEGNGRAAIVVRLSTGGAHCCSIVHFHVTLPDMPGTYTSFEKDFGDPGMKIGPRAPDGHIELVSADDRFAYAFAPYAYSALPLQIWELRGMGLTDVTRSFKAAVAADAGQQWRRFRAHRRGRFALGFAAAWSADERLLGRGTAAFTTLRREARAGHLRGGGLPREAGGTAFIARLQRFLRSNGY